MPLLRYDTPLVLPNGEEVWAVKWEESEHPRQPAGSPEGGEFAESTAAARARREWVAAEQARLEALPGYSRAEARGEAEANWSRGGVIPGSMPVTRVGPADKFKYGAEEPEDPTHFYHITTRPMLRVVLRDGLRPGGPQTMAAGAYRNASYGKVFVTDRQGVAYWRDRIEAHLEHEYDRPPKLDVVRLPRASVAAAPDPNRSHLEANSWVITPLSTSKAWDESQHPRVPAGSEAGGEFTNGGGGAAVIDPKMTAAAARELPEVPFEELGSTGGWLFADGSAHLSDWYQSHASAAAHFLTEALVGDAAWSPQEDDRIIGEFSRRTGAVRIIEGVDGGLGIATARPLSPAQARIAVRYARESGTPLTADFYQHDGTAISQVFPRPTVEAVTAWYDAQYSQTKSAVTKAPAPAPDLPNLAALADKLAPSLRQDFLDAVAAMQASSAQELEALASALGRGDVDQAETLLRFDALTRGLTEAWVPTLRQGFLMGAEAAMAALQPVVTAGFHLVSQRALEWAHAHAGDLVTEITDETADAIRTWVERGFAEGVPVRELAQQISHLVGLRSDQVDALARYQAELIDGGMAMGATGDKVGRYANQLLRQRAELIARNEVMTASGEGQWAQWQAAVEQGLIDPDTVQKQWIIAHDERTCPICLPLDGLTLGLNDPFPGGFQHPPAHIQCRCGVGLVFPSAGKGWVVRWDPVIKWDESQHPRVPAGSEAGGEFTAGDGGGGVATVEAGPDPEAPAFPDAVGGRRLPQDPGDPFWGLQTQGRAGVDHPYDGERPDAPRSWNQAAAWAKALVTTAELPPINREVNAMTWYGHLYYQDCFRQAFQFLLRYQGPGAVLVHGTYEPTGTDPVPAAHAWVELPGHRIFDGVQQRIFDAAQYRALYHTQDVKRYQETAAMRTAVKTQHYGPWWGPGIVARSGGTMAATSTKNKPIPPKELARLQRQLDARKAWDESQHPRVPAGTEQGGEFASGSGAPPPPWGSTADAGERALIRSMLEREFGLREYQLAIQPGTGPLRGSEFGLARQFVEGGHFDPQTDSIVLWANAHKLHEIISMAAHEAAHARFDWMDRMWKVEQDRLLTESEYPYTTAAETALKPAYQARYPATTIELELGRKTPPTAELQATGPQVSPYAALYWEAWSRGVRLPRGINTALDETLAEVSRIVHDQNGKYPAGFPEPWRRYHQAREAAYLQMRALPAATSHA